MAASGPLSLAFARAWGNRLPGTLFQKSAPQYTRYVKKIHRGLLRICCRATRGGTRETAQGHTCSHEAATPRKNADVQTGRFFGGGQGFEMNVTAKISKNK
jgi:hypothetical protein